MKKDGSMDNNLRRIKEKISRKEITLGTCVSLTDPEIAEVFCSVGFDFIWIDGEHSSLDNSMINMHIAAIRGWGVAPIVRVPWNDPVRVKPILEMGPAGIIFPLVKTAEEAKQAVYSCKYPPRGIRGFGPRRANKYSSIILGDYLKQSENEPWVMIQIEHIDGVNNLEEIVKLEGVDCIVIGPMDLSGSIGLLGQTDHIEVIKLFDRIAEICNRNNTIFLPSIGYDNIENLKSWIKRGASIFCLDWDIGHLIKSGKNAIDSAIKAKEELKK